MKYTLSIIVFFSLFITACQQPITNIQDIPIDQIDLPEGFEIEVYAYPVPGARSMDLSPEGILFVGTRKVGAVYAILDEDKDFKADEIITVATGMNNPNGIAFRNGSLYVAEINRVNRYDHIESNLKNPPSPVIIQDDLPDEEHHGWKYMAFGPDNKLYFQIGAPCNLCYRTDERYASIMRMNPDGSDMEVFAHGVRNTVGFDFHPETGELWFTDNGRDWLGEDMPPDELNHAPTQGLHFGYPFCHGKNISDPEFNIEEDCSNYLPAAVELGPHVAALGMKFYTGDMFPEEYTHDIFIAEHGSWNRRIPIGYRVTRVKIENNTAVSYEIFAEGWLQDGESWGRPVDILQMPDGSILISDDKAGAIYRISYDQKTVSELTARKQNVYDADNEI